MKIRIGIIGGAGYTAGELIRLLLNHPQAELFSIVSTTQAGKKISDIHTDLIGDLELRFVEKLATQLDVVFLCVEHGKAGKIMQQMQLEESIKVVDLSNEFRVYPNHTVGKRIFQYGVPSLYEKVISKSFSVSNPGCFATAIELALLPLAKSRALSSAIHIHAVTGSTGSGRSFSETNHFSWRHSNVSFYKEFKHQHLAEIKQTLQHIDADFKQPIIFLPMRGNFTRGILAGIYLQSPLTVSEVVTMYNDFYISDPFVIVSKKAIHLKQVVNTNKCLLHIQKIDNQLLITSALDNLVKGASGQAIQNMNIMFGLDQTVGLNSKGIGF